MIISLSERGSRGEKRGELFYPVTTFITANKTLSIWGRGRGLGRGQ